MELLGWILKRKSVFEEEASALVEWANETTFRSVLNEALELFEKVPDATSSAKPELIPSKTSNNKVVWRIKRHQRKPVFMRADRYPNEKYNKDRWVAHVNAKQFYFWWRWSAIADPSRLNDSIKNHRRPTAYINIESDYKYDSQRHWQDGIENPTVLPEVHCSLTKGIEFSLNKPQPSDFIIRLC